MNLINVDIRSILVGWLVEVSEEHKLVSGALYYSVSCIDWFLSLNAICYMFSVLS